MTLVSCFAILSCTSTKEFIKSPEKLKEIRKVAVIPFRCSSEGYGLNIAESLSTNLLMSRLSVIERGQLEKILQEHNLTMEGIVNGDQSYVGKLVGVDALIIGSATVDRGFAGVMNGGNKDYVNNCTAKMVDVQTGEIISAATYSSNGPSTMSGITTATEVGEKLAKKFISYF